eukprot:gene21295-9105_t
MADLPLDYQPLVDLGNDIFRDIDLWIPGPTSGLQTTATSSIPPPLRVVATGAAIVGGPGIQRS